MKIDLKSLNIEERGTPSIASGMIDSPLNIKWKERGISKCEIYIEGSPIMLWVKDSEIYKLKRVAKFGTYATVYNNYLKVGDTKFEIINSSQGGQEMEIVEIPYYSHL